jgi:hypothetical protein
MSERPFDPTKAVTFDLAHGLVHLEDAPSRVLVPAEALAALAEAAGPDQARSFARTLGEPLGRRVARRLSDGGGPRAASIDAVMEHLAGELALAGLGVLSLERWGRALVLVVDQCPLGKKGEALLAGVLEGAVGAAGGVDLHCVPLMSDGPRTRVLLSAAAAADRVRGWIKEGVSFGDVLVRLHGSTEARGAA